MGGSLENFKLACIFSRSWIFSRFGPLGLFNVILCNCPKGFWATKRAGENTPDISGRSHSRRILFLSVNFFLRWCLRVLERKPVNITIVSNLTTIHSNYWYIGRCFAHLPVVRTFVRFVLHDLLETDQTWQTVTNFFAQKGGAKQHPRIESRAARGVNVYPAGRNYYTCNWKTIKSVSASVILFVINSETVQECKCNGEL